jgi:serine/threonine protein kinase
LVDTAGRPLNLVHRDVSPSNILLSSQGQVKLTDFGVAKALGREETRGGVVKGKYGYMSPQQVQQQPLDASSDQFSLATVLLESLTGASVFVGAGPLQIMEKVLEGSVPEIPAAHREALPDLEALLGRMLALEPKDRLADTRAVARVLSEMLARLEAHAPHEELAALVRKVMSRTSEHAEDNTSDTQSATLDELAVSGRPESETDHYGPPLGAPSAPPDAASPRPDDDTSQYRIAQLEPTQGAATDRPVHEP